MIILTHEILEEVTDIYAFIVLVKSIAKRASFDQYQKSFPSLKTICIDTLLSKPTVIKALKMLEDLKIIQVQRSKRDGINNVNHYSICTDKIKTIGSLKLEGGSKPDLLGVVNEIDKGSKPDLLGVVNEIDTNLKSILTSSPNNQNKRSNKFDQNKFEEFWTLYPRKTGKGKAKQSYQKAIAKISEQNLIQALKDRLEDLDKLEPQFIPHPSTWLNQERWEDEITNKPVTPATPEEVEQRRQEWQESLARTQTSKPIQNIQTSYFKPLNLF